jgi:hypothetical protein
MKAQGFNIGSSRRLGRRRPHIEAGRLSHLMIATTSSNAAEPAKRSQRCEPIEMGKPLQSHQPHQTDFFAHSALVSVLDRRLKP